MIFRSDVVQEDDTRLVGQCEISHPVRRVGPSDPSDLDPAVQDAYESATKATNVAFTADSKDDFVPLEAPIQRVWIYK